jgi:hypothetical protein
MTEHTAGPWQATRISAYEQHDRLAVASVAPGQAELILVLHTFDGSQAEANVRLMAAAPDLLAALEEIEAHHVQQNHLKGRDENRSRTLRIARAALAKARGTT